MPLTLGTPTSSWQRSRLRCTILTSLQSSLTRDPRIDVLISSPRTWSKRGFAMLGRAQREHTRQTLLPIRFCRLGGWLLVVAVFVGECTELRGQTFAEDRPAPYVPVRPPARKEIERRDSLKEYVRGLLLERADQLLNALKAFEEAARLDPDAPAAF